MHVRVHIEISIIILLVFSFHFSFLFPNSGASKKEEAADLFVRAANQYKVAKCFKGTVRARA